MVGQAKRLALNPPNSAWGRSMHAKRGGLAVQRRYWLEGRHPTTHATSVRLGKQERKKAADLFRAQYGPFGEGEEQGTEGREMKIKHLPLF